MKSRPLPFALFLLFLLLGAGFISYSIFLPRYIEKKILPDLGHLLSSSLAGQVYSIGLSAADFGEIILGNPQNPALSIGSIHTEYSLQSLLAKKLGKIRINGLALHLEIINGGFFFRGTEPWERTPQTSRQKTRLVDPAGIDLPFEVKNIQVSNGLIEISYDGRRFQLPFNLELNRNPNEKSLPVYNLSLQMMPLGEAITLTGNIDLAGNKSKFSLVAPSLDLKKFAVLGGGDMYDISPGRVFIKGETEIVLQPFQLLAANLRIDPELLHVGKTPVRFGRRAPDSDPAISLEIKRDREQLLITLQTLMSEPLSAFLELKGFLVQDHDNVKSSGYFVIRAAETVDTAIQARGFLLPEGIPALQADFALDLDKSGTWKAELKSTGLTQQDNLLQDLHIQYDKISLQTGMPAIVLQGQGTAEAYEILLSSTLPGVKARYEGAALIIPEAGLQASYRKIEDQGRGSSSHATFYVASSGTKYQKNSLSGKADIFIQGDIVPAVASENAALQAEGRIALKNTEMTDSDAGVELRGLEGDIPWSWPQSGREMAGEIKVPQIRWKDIDLGSFKGDIKRKEMSYFLEGAYHSTILAGIVTKIYGKAGIAGSQFHGELALQSDMTPFAAINLGRFAPSLEKSYFSGNLGLEGALKLEAGALNGRLQVKLQNGKYEFPAKNYEIKNIDFSMLIPSLPDLRTAPAQTLNFAEASIGNLTFSNGKLVWQLESKKTVFLEEGVVQWAGGRIFTNSVRISPESKGIVVPVICDRLRLTQILQQLGVRNAEGEGTVNGRIPLQVSRNTIRFEDGFLYSSPGQGGSVKVAAFDILAAGIPKNTPQFTQVDFAAEALKNFQYNWVKLVVNTEGEDLIMQMQMDGKPVQALPFKYDSRTGLLQRIEDGSQGISQPIRLDVNFRLPLNRFLGYSGKVQDIMKKMQ